MNKRLVFFINSADLFLSHRQHLAQGALRAGYDLTILVPPGPAVEEVRALGYKCETVTMGRKSIFPLFELWSLWRVIMVLRRLRPDILHSFTIKPVLYGTIAARLTGIPSVVNTVTGLGYAFIDQGIKARMVRAVLGPLYRMLFRSPRLAFIFQNRDDLEFYLRQEWVSEAQSQLIPGTGVDTEAFTPMRALTSEPVILFAGRYLKDKGLGELMEACGQMWKQGLRFRLLLCGRIDHGNPNSFTAQNVEQWRALEFVEELGFQKSMAPVYRRADIVCLPSYREGIPLTLIEASSCGNALVTTDVPGCREVVTDGENGLLVAPFDAAALKSALERLILSPELRQKLGEKARRQAVERFAKEKLVERGLSVYHTALKQAG